MSDNDNLIDKIEHFFDDDEAPAPAAEEGDPPAGWTVPPVPTDPDEQRLLEEAFGEPDADGIYGPRGNA